MYIKVTKGSETFKKLSELSIRIDKSDKIAKNVCKELGALPQYASSSSSSYLIGHPDGLKFKTEPDTNLFRRVGDKYDNLWYPKAKNKSAFKVMEQLAPIKKKELHEIVGWSGIQMIGLCIVDSVGIDFHKEYHLLEIYKGAKFTPNADMVELKESEWMKLKSKEK